MKIKPPERSRTSLASFVAETRDDGKKVVVVPGYKREVFGYYVCLESHEAVGNPHDDWYVYTKVASFTPKTSDTTYQEVVASLRG